MVIWNFPSSQGFIQAVLLISVFERRLSLQMLYFVKSKNCTMKVEAWMHSKFCGGSMAEPGWGITFLYLEGKQ